MTAKLFARMRDEAFYPNKPCVVVPVNLDMLKKICEEFESRMEGVNRNNIILERSICPAGKCRLNQEGK